ncbi:MAG: SDR family oxidoreductase [Pseudomonadales bacterium]|jgi:NAD(P)-dependent dehydrogenase (short-subunit alcohol dehydrogenase family)|nr:SDR family oxidoreductase [Pseudomonadales bacterium]MDP6470005.1 SDR family oxidoreductase [Pseudomonadales bacterium]MDP6826905.1 SDR family oxidoreductase [Pseudomonadales bacterium]|tara:strand:- start:558 stop:1346 length:789 start_codon:yes stop_codon:yes gene_type:complete
MKGRLEGKSALITGGGTGIGAAIARRFTQSGARVVLTGRRTAQIESVASELNGIAVPGDTTNPGDCANAVAAALGAHGRLDILVANAGVMSLGSATTLEPDEWEETLRINVSGVMQICRAAIPAMTQARSGSIVTIGSVAGLSAMRDTTAYVTGKHALIGFTKTLAIDYGAAGIRANTLCPGWVRTPMSDEEMVELGKRLGVGPEEALARTVAPLPLGRMAEPFEIAACAEFLASDDAAFVTGIALVADGGGEVVDVGAIAG